MHKHFIVGDTCKHNSFHLEPEVYPSDAFYLIKNGTLLVPEENTAYNASQFCFENVLSNSPGDGLSDQILRAFVCFPENSEPVEKLIVYPVSQDFKTIFVMALAFVEIL